MFVESTSSNPNEIRGNVSLSDKWPKKGPIKRDLVLSAKMKPLEESEIKKPGIVVLKDPVEIVAAIVGYCIASENDDLIGHTEREGSIPFAIELPNPKNKPPAYVYYHRDYSAERGISTEFRIDFCSHLSDGWMSSGWSERYYLASKHQTNNTES